MTRCNEKVKTSVTIERGNMVIPCTAVTCIEAATKRPVASYILGCIIRDKVVSYYYIDTSVLLGTKLTTRRFHTPLHPGPEWRIFRMSPLRVSYRSMTFNDVTIPAFCFCVSLKLYLNSLVYHRNIFGSSSRVFGNLRTSSEIFGKCSGKFVWPSEQFWKIFGNLRRVVGNLRKIIKNAVIGMYKKNITRRLEDMNFIFSWQKQCFTHSLRPFVKYCFATRK